jgi:hypothetical protein
VRRFTFGLVVVTAFIVAACGRQVTPNPTGFGAGGAAPGSISIKFDVASQFNFSNYQYWVVFDTTGDGKTPSTFPQRDGWNGYWGAIEVGGGIGTTFAAPYHFLRQPPLRTPVIRQLIGLSPQQFQYIANSNGTGTEFTILVQRSIFLNNFQNPSPSPSPLALNWTYNAFTTQGNFLNQPTFVDSMGVGGPVDPQYVSPVLNTAQCFDMPFTSLYGGQTIDPAAQISTVEIANNPSPAPSISPC